MLVLALSGGVDGVDVVVGGMKRPTETHVYLRSQQLCKTVLDVLTNHVTYLSL